MKTMAMGFGLLGVTLGMLFAVGCGDVTATDTPPLDGAGGAESDAGGMAGIGGATGAGTGGHVAISGTGGSPAAGTGGSPVVSGIGGTMALVSDCASLGRHPSAYTDCDAIDSGAVPLFKNLGSQGIVRCVICQETNPPRAAGAPDCTYAAEATLCVASCGECVPQ